MTQDDLEKQLRDIWTVRDRTIRDAREKASAQAHQALEQYREANKPVAVSAPRALDIDQIK